MSCPDCFTGAVKHNEKPTGQETKIHGRNTYVANPPAGTKPKGIIVIVPDAFGWEFVNNRILADNYARQGNHTVYLPDFMDGRAAPGWMLFAMDGVLHGPWLWKPYNLFWTLAGFAPFLASNRLSVTMPRVTGFLEGVRAGGEGSLPVGVAGFCWGGMHVMDLAKGEKKTGSGRLLADVLFTAHPSMTSVPGDYENLRVPLAVAIGDRDNQITGATLEKLKETLEKQKDVKTELVIYEGAGHGFSVRTDPGNEKQTQQAKDAEDQAVKWFAQRFAEISS